MPACKLKTVSLAEFQSPNSHWSQASEKVLWINGTKFHEGNHFPIWHPTWHYHGHWDKFYFAWVQGILLVSGHMGALCFRSTPTIQWPGWTSKRPNSPWPKPCLLTPLTRATEAWGMWTTPNRFTQFTYFFMMYGAEAIMLADVLHDSPRVTACTEAKTEVARRDGLHLLEEAQELTLSMCYISRAAGVGICL